MINSLGDSNPVICAEAKSALIEFGQGTTDSLFSALHHASGKQYSEIILVLGKIRDKRALDYLVLLNDSLPGIVPSGMVDNLRQDLMPEQTNKENVYNYPSYKVDFDSTDVDSLLALVSSSNNPESIRAVEALGKIKDSRIVPTLIGFVNNKTSSYKIEDMLFSRNVIDALGEQKDTSAVLPLIELLNQSIAAVSVGEKAGYKHRIDNICLTVVIALGQIGDARAVKPISEILFMGKDLRRICAFALGEIASPDAIDALTKAAESPDPNLKEAGILGLIGVNIPAVMPELIKQLEYVSYICTKPCEGSQPEIMVKRIADTGWKPSNEKENFYWNVICCNYDSINVNFDEYLKFINSDLESDFYYKSAGAQRVLEELRKY